MREKNTSFWEAPCVKPNYSYMKLKLAYGLCCVKNSDGCPYWSLKFLKAEIYMDIIEDLYLSLGEFSVPAN